MSESITIELTEQPIYMNLEMGPKKELLDDELGGKTEFMESESNDKIDMEMNIKDAKLDQNFKVLGSDDLKRALGSDGETDRDQSSSSNSDECANSSLTSDSVIDPKREVSSDTEDFVSDSQTDNFDVFAYDDLKLPKTRLLPIWNDEPDKPKELARYTVGHDFHDHWLNKSALDDERLSHIIRLWSSDNWEGLYDPPEWLTAAMFTVALVNEPSNKRKRDMLMEATTNLEIARLTSSNEMPDLLKKEAIRFLETSKPMLTDYDSNESFIIQAKRIALIMHRIYTDLKAILQKQTSEYYKIKDDFLLTTKTVLQGMEEMVGNYDDLSKNFTEKMKMLEDLHDKMCSE